VIDPDLDQVRQLLRLRRMRLDASERAMREARETLAKAESTLAEGQDMQRRWDAAAADFEAWVEGARERMHRLLPTIEARRAEFVRGAREAAEYIAWWRDKTDAARAALAEAQALWARDHARHEALQARLGELRRRQLVLETEALGEEQADTLAALHRARRQR
jgi:hypothetical protein